MSNGIAAKIAERGFAVVQDLFAAGEMAALLEEIGRTGLPHTRAGLRHALRVPTVTTLSRDERLMSIACSVLGEDASAFRATLFDKSPGSNWLVVWHQDTALPLRERRDVAGWGPWSVKDGVDYAHAPAEALARVLALRVHLDDSSADNGPLRVLPGSHRSGVLSDAEIQTMAQSIAPVDCVAPRGSVVAMRPLIVHASFGAVLRRSRPYGTFHILAAYPPLKRRAIGDRPCGAGGGAPSTTLQARKPSAVPTGLVPFFLRR